MYQELPLTAFLKALRKFCRTGKSGTVFFLTEDDGWGKIAIEAGNIQNYEYKRAEGEEALALLNAQDKVKFYVKPASRQKPEDAQDALSLKNTEDFFAYFGLEYGLNSPAAREALGESDQKTPPTKPHVQVSRSTGSRREKKILIADDSSIVRKLVVNTLSEAGYTLIEARSGFEALGQLSNESPDLLLLDLIMPGVDGYEVLKMVRKNEKLQHMPVIILTSRNSLMDKLRGKMSKSDEYLTKPFDKETLLRTVQKYL